ncbi:MAG TPA: hypothetical protein VN029_01215, partial [Sphingomonas sp.]|nr:hypothetical protein [Sphingomonas sp.]
MNASAALQMPRPYRASAATAPSDADSRSWLGELLPRDRKPLYAQFAQLLRKAISDGRLEAG